LLAPLIDNERNQRIFAAEKPRSGFDISQDWMVIMTVEERNQIRAAAHLPLLNVDAELARLAKVKADAEFESYFAQHRAMFQHLWSDSRHGDVARTRAANEGIRRIFAQAIGAHHGSVQGDIFKTKLVLAGRPSVSLMSTRTICSPGGSSVSGMSMPVGITNCLMRGSGRHLASVDKGP
jgi:hypothetical protein